VDYASGKDAEREKFQELFSLAARRQIDVVVVWALDRFSREGVAETFAHIQKLASYGVGLVSVTEPHFRTPGPAGELLIAVAAWIAKQERIRISERVRAGLETAFYAESPQKHFIPGMIWQYIGLNPEEIYGTIVAWVTRSRKQTLKRFLAYRYPPITRSWFTIGGPCSAHVILQLIL
jgi:DNA invertase Pin-like site-specific DNA recombinase